MEADGSFASPRVTQPHRHGASIIVPVLNSRDTLSACLGGIDAALRRGGHTEAVVIDHGSTDGSWELITARDGGIVPLRSLEGTVGALRNLGARRSRGDLLVFVDADCVIGPDHLDRARDALEETGAAAAGSTYELPANPHWIERVWFSLHAPPPDGPVRWINGGNLVVRRRAFEAVGGFDESLETGEDVELCHRLVRAGFLIVHDRRISAFHLGNPKTLRDFVRQQWWHGLGMLPAARRLGKSRPLVMTAVHVALAVLVPGLAIVIDASASSTVGMALLAQAVVPLSALAFRYWQLGRVVNPVAGLLLYWIYFWCRVCALGWRLLVPRPASSGRKTPSRNASHPY
jgi:GT2 family glycosyltransferase